MDDNSVMGMAEVLPVDMKKAHYNDHFTAKAPIAPIWQPLSCGPCMLVLILPTSKGRKAGKRGH